jgi:site-specific recombinase
MLDVTLPETELEALLVLLSDPAREPVAALAQLVAYVRPPRGQIATVEQDFQALIALLENRPELRDALRGTVLKLFDERHAVLLFATSGIYPETGILTETLRRISHRLLRVPCKGTFDRLVRIQPGQLALRPEVQGAAQEVTNGLKHFLKRSRRRSTDSAGRNASEH